MRYLLLLFAISLQAQSFEMLEARRQALTAEPPTPFEDYYNLIVDFTGPDTVAFDQRSTWNGDDYDDWVHPSVVYKENGWNGHSYWMGVNPYAATQAVTENPFLFYSDDGQTWTTPAGLTQPIFGIAADSDHNSDSQLVIEGDSLRYFNRGVLTAGGAYIDVVSTVDGVNFTPRRRVVSSEDGFPNYVSHSFIKLSGVWHLFATDVTDKDALCVLTSSDLYGPYTEVNRISTGNLGDLWHNEVQYADGTFYLMGATGDVSGGDLVLAKFDDIMDATMQTRNTFLLPRQDQPWNNAYYKSSFQVIGNIMEIWLGLKGPLLNSSTLWRVQKVNTSRATPSLDLSGYTLVGSWPLADVANGFSNGMRNAGYNKMALQYTVVDPWDFDVQVPRRNTTFYQSYRISNGRTLEHLSWRSGSDVNDFIEFGMKAGDVVTIIRDGVNYTIYIQGINVYSVADPSDEHLGTLFGNFANNGAISNLNLYMRPEWIFSEADFDTNLANMFTDSGTNPASYLVVDDFNRTTLGTTDNIGNTYDIIGTPTINNDTRARFGSGNIVGRYHSENHYITYVVPSPDSNWGSGRVYFNYTDASNNRWLEVRDGGGFFLHTVTGGSDTVVQIETVSDHPNHTRFAFEVNGTVLTIYGDGVAIRQSYPLPDLPDDYAGVGAQFTSRYVNDLIIQIQP